MNAVMSLSTAPKSFRATRDYLLLHTLAFVSARRFFPSIELVTDEMGLVIADRMRWNYTNFRLDLTSLDSRLREIWSAGKLLAQLAQSAPYAHIDNDLILHAPLPEDIASAEVFAQSKDEPGFYLARWAQLAMIRANIDRHACAYNTGLVGGNNVEALHEYARECLEAMLLLHEHPQPHGVAILVEQSVFGQFFARKQMKVAEMIPLPLSATDDDFKGREFTHLWGSSKRNWSMLGRVELRLMLGYPEDYENFLSGFGRLEVALSARKFCIPWDDSQSGPAPIGGCNMSLSKVSAPGDTKVAVVLTCHPGYLGQLRAAVDSIEGQGFTEKVLVFDAGDQASEFKQTPIMPLDWKVIMGDWKNPNSARNAGLYSVESPWICFWDSDNVMPHGYLACSEAYLRAAEPRQAVLYPRVQQITPTGLLGHAFPSVEWSREAGCRYSLCDTSSFWRKEALVGCGGWGEWQIDHDDYELALRLYRFGWEGKRLPITMRHQSHGANRSRRATEEDQERCNQSLWTAYTFGMVTLWSGRTSEWDLLEQLGYFARETFPPQTSLYWLVDSKDEYLRLMLERNAHWLRGKFVSITIISTKSESYNTSDRSKPYLELSRHSRVAALYNEIIRRVVDEVVVLLEDDTRPPIGGLRKLVSHIRPWNDVAMVSSVYRQRNDPEHACMARRLDAWDDCPKMDELPDEPFRIGMAGGGFCVVANWALRECLPLTCNYSPRGHLMGWDGNLGMALTARGYKLLAHPGVRADHRCPEVIEYESHLPAH